MDKYKIGLIVLGIISIVYYLIIAIFVKNLGGFALVWLFFGVFFIFVSIALKNNWIPSFFRNKMIKIVILCIFLIFFLLFSVIEVIIIYNANTNPTSEAEYIVILGARVNGTSITISLQMRLDAAIEYIEEHPNVKVVVSGGMGPTEEITEALAMKDYLVEHGVDSDNIIMEDKSTNTQENMKFTKDLIGKDKRIIVVSNGFHIFRAVRIAKKQGFTEVEGLGAKTNKTVFVNLYVREVFGVVKDFVCGNI